MANVVALDFASPLRAARFRRRLSRFSASVEVDGAAVPVHVPNSGRLSELLVDGACVWLEPKPGPQRRTGWDLVVVAYQDLFVCVDARLPNALVARAIARGRVEGLDPRGVLRREARVGRSRLDFVHETAAGRTYVEVKSVTLVVDGCARFPDAPTVRGARHLAELAALSLLGHRAMAIFVVQRADARAFAPNEAADPAFAAALRAAAVAGVDLRAYRCEVALTGMSLLGSIPVLLDGPTEAAPLAVE